MIWSLLWRWLLILVVFAGGTVLAFGGNFWMGVSLHIFLVGYLLSGTLNPSSRLFGKVRTRCGSGIWLTLDDGPDPDDTPMVLDLLDRYGAKATFFVIGQKAEKYPDLIREIHRRGHQLGNHSWSHPRAFFWCLGPIRTYREIVKCQRTIERITGAAPTVFRAPVGHYNVFVHPVLKREKLELIGWSSRGFDGVGADFESVRERIRASANDGSIVLAHEATPIAGKVVTDILDLAQERGWTCSIPAHGSLQ
ncbi:polysaccharide deacetylase family protein [Luteolibacter algae]|uniref:Polysaccharide deacetylase family protein n=1 Tax=Luteolibacter algae TaxID=454151 RepID=A0ABW5D9A7_9BACT